MKIFKYKLLDGLDYFIILLIIINSRSMISRALNDDLLLIVMLVLAIVKFLIEPKIYTYRYFTIKYGIILLSSFLLIAIINHSPYYKTIGVIIVIISVMIYSLKTSQYEYALKYVKIMYIIAVLSLLSWIIALMFNSFSGISIPINNIPHRIIGINFYETSELKFNSYYLFGIKIYRNNSIFWEGGAYQIFLVIGLLYNYKYLKSDKYQNIFIVSILTTISSIGYIILCIYLIYILNTMNKYKYLFSVLTVVGYLILSNNWLFENVIFYKIGSFIQVLSGQYYSNSYDVSLSGFRRAIDISVDLKIFSSSPIFGAGLQNLGLWGDIYRNMVTGSYSYGASSSNGLTTLLSSMGFLFTVLFIYIININKILNNTIIYWCIILLLITSQNILLMPIFIAFVFI